MTGAWRRCLLAVGAEAPAGPQPQDEDHRVCGQSHHGGREGGTGTRSRTQCRLTVIPIDFDMYWTSISSIRRCYIYIYYVVEPISAPYLRPVALETKMADAQVEYKRVDLQSYEARNGASFAQSFKYNFSFPSMYRRLKSTRLIQCYERQQI